MITFRAELGHTHDPKALVPGDAGAVRDTARTMRCFGEALVTASQGLRKIDDGGWTGEAADAFHDAFDPEPARWLGCGDAFLGAGEALCGYVDTLEWAQGQAKEAIALWNQAERSTEAARKEHDAQVKQAVSHGDTGSLTRTLVFHDPGEAKREQARAILERAREQLDAAGDGAERVVGQARDKAPPKPKWWQKALHVGLDVVAVPPYFLYYASYNGAKVVNKVGEHLGPAGSAVSHNIAAPLVVPEAIGLGGDVAIDWVKGHTVAEESTADEGKKGYINPFHEWLPEQLKGPKVYLPGVHPDGKIDFEW